MREVAGRPAAGEREETYLYPGRLAVAARPLAITTILGSCVGVCLYDAGAGVGGTAHALLPVWPGSGGPPSARWADCAVRFLLDRLVSLGARRGALRAKVFGGACVLPAFRDAREHLGGKNVDAAVEALGIEGIEIVAGDVGGTRGRKLVFHTDDGAAWVKRI